MNTSSEKVAIVCDWLTEIGGAERVILAVHTMYPTAPIYTSQYRPKRATWFNECDVRTGWLNRLPVSIRRFIPFLRQWYFSCLNLSEYDLVISITGAEAKAVKTRADAFHVSYIHAPTQYYWTLYDQYIENPGFGVLNPLARIGLKLLVGPLRKADFKAAQKPDAIIANSSYIQDEIRAHYQRESEVIWPNVDIERIIQLSQHPASRQGFISFGRQVSWKRFDVAIAAALSTGKKLTLIGDGPEHDALVKQAGSATNITFLPRYNGFESIVDLVASSEAFIFPSVEPFGIAAVEALASGTPIIGLKAGGALDIIDETNGIFFNEQTAESLSRALEDFSTKQFDSALIQQSANKFSEAEFRRRMTEVVEHHRAK